MEYPAFRGTNRINSKTNEPGQILNVNRQRGRNNTRQRINQLGNKNYTTETLTDGLTIQYHPSIFYDKDILDKFPTALRQRMDKAREEYSKKRKANTDGRNGRSRGGGRGRFGGRGRGCGRGRGRGQNDGQSLATSVATLATSLTTLQSQIQQLQQGNNVPDNINASEDQTPISAITGTNNNVMGGRRGRMLQRQQQKNQD